MILPKANGLRLRMSEIKITKPTNGVRRFTSHLTDYIDLIPTERLTCLLPNHPTGVSSDRTQKPPKPNEKF